LDTLRHKTGKTTIGLAFLTLFSVARFCTAPFAGLTSSSDVSTGSGPTMTISPSSGPTGTTATITITGALPNASVTVDLDPGGTTGTTDANGEWTHTLTFNGQVGDISNVVATIGNANEQTASATFEITGELEQVFNAITDILSDKGGHAEFIRMLLALILNVSPGSNVIERPDPWVTVIGEIGDDGSFIATGRGTLAGFPDIAVVGESITYLVIGEAEDSAATLASDFVDLINASQGAGDSARMFDMLHPTVVDLYGEAACTGYLASIVNPEVSIKS